MLSNEENNASDWEKIWIQSLEAGEEEQGVNQTLKSEMAEYQKAFDLWKQAIEEVQQLKGIIPTCMHCKEIRDEGRFWNITKTIWPDTSL